MKTPDDESGLPNPEIPDVKQNLKVGEQFSE